MSGIITQNFDEIPYVFQEYPKWVTLADGSRLIVNNAEEETAATVRDEEEGTDLSKLSVADLKLRADALGVEYAANVLKADLIAAIEAEEKTDDFE